jgi:hypothetical protein
VPHGGDGALGDDAADEILATARALIAYLDELQAERTLDVRLLPEALLLAAVELAGRMGDDAEGIADWLGSIAARVRETPLQSAGRA